MKILFVFVFFIIACNSGQNSPSTVEHTGEHIDSGNERKIDTVTRVDATYASKYGSILDTIIENNHRKLESILHLDKMNSLENSIQVRVWLEEGLTDTGMVIIFKCRNSKWSAQTFDYMARYSKSNELQSARFDSSGEVYALDNESLNNSIGALDLETYRVYKNISNYYVCNNGGVAVVEASNSNFYIKNPYPCWDTQSNSIPEVSGIRNLLELVQSDFKFKLKTRLIGRLKSLIGNKK